MSRFVLIGILLTITTLTLVACEPKDRRAGLWLSGEVVTAPVTDWSFSNAHNEIFIETNTVYLVPHSVTTTVVTSAGTLYVPSLYQGGGEFPSERYWNRNIARDPNVRLKIGDEIYERRASLVTDPDERTKVLAAFAAKYEYWRELLKNGDPERPKIILLRMDPRNPA